VTSLDDDSYCDNGCIQLMNLGTHMIYHSDSDKGSNKEQEDSINKRLGQVTSLRDKTQTHFLLHEKCFVMCMVHSSTHC
jgi:hypothetical protein